MLKKILIGSIAAATMTASAYAADLPVRPPPPPPVPVCIWCGFYIGVNGGGYSERSNSLTLISTQTFANPALTDFGRSELANAGLGGSGVFNLPRRNGFMGGGQAGINWQWGMFVAGAELDFQATSRRNDSFVAFSSLPTTFAGVNTISVIGVSRGLDYLGTARGRLGLTFGGSGWNWGGGAAGLGGSFLLYATGGAAYGGVRSNVSIAQAIVPFVDLTNTFSTGPLSSGRVGWTAGAGIEWMFLPNWSLKAEYLYYDLG